MENKGLELKFSNPSSEFNYKFILNGKEKKSLVFENEETVLLFYNLLDEAKYKTELEKESKPLYFKVSNDYYDSVIMSFVPSKKKINITKQQVEQFDNYTQFGLYTDANNSQIVIELFTKK